MRHLVQSGIQFILIKSTKIYQKGHLTYPKQMNLKSFYMTMFQVSWKYISGGFVLGHSWFLAYNQNLH